RERLAPRWLKLRCFDDVVARLRLRRLYHDGDAFACAPRCRLPLGVPPLRSRRRGHAERTGSRCGIARHAYPCGAWTSCRPCALPPTPRYLAALGRLRGLPRSFSIAPRKSRRYAAGAHSILRWREDTSAWRNHQILFGGSEIGRLFEIKTRCKIPVHF